MSMLGRDLKINVVFPPGENKAPQLGPRKAKRDVRVGELSRALWVPLLNCSPQDRCMYEAASCQPAAAIIGGVKCGLFAVLCVLTLGSAPVIAI